MLSLALETNGNGWIGFIVELPGAYVRGRTRQEAVDKAIAEAAAYRRWLGESADVEVVRIVQEFQSQAAVEDGDTVILLEAECGKMPDDEFFRFTGMAWHSAQCFHTLFRETEHKDRVDAARTGSTFYGDTPDTIQRMHDHVNRCQLYYLAQVGLDAPPGEFLVVRNSVLTALAELYRAQNNERVYEQDGEMWTLQKVLRRLIWHDRIHAKAVVRMLARQQQLGLVSGIKDPFNFLH